MPKKNTAPLGKRKLREAIEDAWYDAPSASAGFGRIEVIINQQIKSVLDELENEAIDANYYIPNHPDDEYTSGEVVRLSTIQKIRSRYE